MGETKKFFAMGEGTKAKPEKSGNSKKLEEQKQKIEKTAEKESDLQQNQNDDEITKA